ncbi:SusE domain-containing protein [Pseudochryseolinea flava]|uniref:SusE outer membrane protein domain-containing protein n=1 Tax=Pseudochryseolinea flava TaxID=2059302 RepID=A0A364XZ02_9BACT|nr:SusE domain-containing protein [Pseudochryseolinea flava]RAV99219.1 hypothetical protein DQQ10_20175 [Pseudochryseolinea flava]
MNTQKYLTWLFMFVALLGIQACDDEKSLNLNVTEVKNLYSPDDNLSIALKPELELTQEFEWDKAYAEDGSLVLYEVAFDQVDGDFSDPIFKVVSDGNGQQTKVSISHGDLNRMAKMGGAESFVPKKFKWTVFSTKGDNMVKAAMDRTIELERPFGFEAIPGVVYITGSATEGGTDLAAAKTMRPLAAGVFEIYTKLKAGTYKFVDAKTGTPNSFFITNSNGAKVVGEDGENTFEGDEKIHRIKLDFNTGAVNVVEVKYVGFWYCWENKIMWELGYAGDGEWRVDDVTVNLTAVPWGLEERHKYKMIINDGEGDLEEWWGYKDNDSPSQDGKYGTAPAEYFHSYKVSGDQWANAWKLDRNAIQGKQVDFILSFNGATPYHMNYVIK